MRSLLTTLVLTTIFATGLGAQKFGYINSNMLLESLPEVAAADKKLENFQSELITQGQTRVQEFETQYRAYLKEVEEGTLSKVQMAEREKKLGEQQQKLAEFEKEVQLKVLQRREELLQPILQTVDEAIQSIGEEGGYTFIFDTSVGGAILHAPAGDDITDLIKAKLDVD